MSKKTSINSTMRIYHQYLGFFLAGIMTVYATSGIVIILRETEFLKSERKTEKTFPEDFDIANLEKAVKNKEMKME